jgi:hypothetical protein
VIQKVDWTKVLGAITSGWSDVAIKIGDAASELERYGRAGKGGGNRAASTEFGAGFGSRSFGEAAGSGPTVSGTVATAVAAGKAAQAAADKAREAAKADAERTRKTIEEIGAYWGALELAAEREAAKAAVETARLQAQANEALAQVAAGQAELIAATQGTKGGVVFGLVRGLLELAAGLREQVRGLLNQVFDLPGAIGKSLEGMLTKLIPRFIERLPQLFAAVFDLPFAIARGVINAIPALGLAIANAVLKGLSNLFNFLRGGEDRNVLTGQKEKVLGTSFKSGEFSLFGLFNQDDRNFGESGRRDRTDRLFGDLFGRKRGRLVGGFIDRTGPYLLHAGERVVPPTGASTSAGMAAMRGGRGGGVTVNVNGALVGTVRDLARMIRRELGDYGTGASLTPRGV